MMTSRLEERQQDTPAAVWGAHGPLLRFLVAGLSYVLPMARIAEVVTLGAATTKAPRGWFGTVVRGERPVPIGDLAYLLGRQSSLTERDNWRALLLRGSDGLAQFGVSIESIPTMIAPGEGTRQSLPALLRHLPVQTASGVLVHGDECLLVLDAEECILRLGRAVKRAGSKQVSQLRSLSLPTATRIAQFTRSSLQSESLAPLAEETMVLGLAITEQFQTAIPAAWVQEVRAPRHTCPIPFAPDALRGLIAWRGRAVPVLDLACRLTDQASEQAGERLIIVGPPGGEALGALLVPAVGSLAVVHAGARGQKVPPLPTTLDPALLIAWTVLGGESLALLNPAALFS